METGNKKTSTIKERQNFLKNLTASDFSEEASKKKDNGITLEQDKDKNTETSEKDRSGQCVCSRFASLFFWSRTQTHIWHLLSKSLAEHEALNLYYDELVELVDSFIESYQGTYDRMKVPKNYKEFVDYENNNQLKEHFKEVKKELDSIRKELDSDENSQLVNIIDDIASLLTKVSFLLTLS